MKNNVKTAYSQNPLVSICMTTYNHERYIKRAVDSILNQHIKFLFELIISDDASLDNTQQILKDNYSSFENIKLILRKENSAGKNAYQIFQEAKGKYIYYCEGDDYWVGMDGLQTLVDWLEEHEDYIGVSGRRVTLSEKTGFMSIDYDKSTNNKDISLHDFMKNEIGIDLCATLYKNFYHDGKYDYRHYLASYNIGDLTTVIYILIHGKAFQLDKIVGVYRDDRIKNVSSYNATKNAKKKFEEHMELISNLKSHISEKLNYSSKKEIYMQWYIDSIPSTYEFFKQIPYLCKQAGVRMLIICIKYWINHI